MFILHSLIVKKMEKGYCNIALNPTLFKVLGSNKMIDLRTLDETDPNVFHTVYYKKVPLVTGDMDETIIVTYSPKYKAYHQKIRSRQIERALKMIQSPGKGRREKIRITLHDRFGFRTDFEFISKASMRGIVSETKKIYSTKTKNSTYRCNRTNSHRAHEHRLYGCFVFY